MVSAPEEQALEEPLRRRDRAAIMRWLRSESGRHLYTACLKVCLNSAKDAAELFDLTLSAALKDLDRFPGLTEERLFGHFHKQWLRFAPERKRLGPSTAPLRFDWTTPEKRNADDAALVLDPLERELFVFRFLFKFPADAVARITGLDETRIGGIFRATLEKLIRS